MSLLGFVVGGSLTAAGDLALRQKGPAEPRWKPSSACWVVAASLTSALFVATFWSFDAGTELLRALVFVGVVVSLAAADLTRGLLPNALTAPATAAGLALSALADPGGWWAYPAGALAVGGGLLVVAVASQGGMGMGDVKMGAMLGAFLGPYAALAVFLGACSGAAVGVSLVAIGALDRGAGLPFGVFMAFGALVSLFFGPEIWFLYRAST